MSKKNNQCDNIGKELEKNQNFIIELFALLYSSTIVALVKKYGDEVFEFSKIAFINAMVNSDKVIFEKIKDKTLKSYIDWFISILSVGHEYKILKNSKKSVKFKFTRCPWASYFREIGNIEIGKFFCIADGPLAKAFNSNIEFKITKTLMNGDNYCNHHYFLKT